MASTQLYYRLTGKGEPVVFLHGFMENNSMWENILPIFKENACYCFEFPGHGKSPVSFPYEIKELAEEIKRNLDQLRIQNPTIIGHSLGGYLALELAKISSFKQVILYHSHPWEDSDTKKIDRSRIAEFVYEKRDLFVGEAIPGLFLDAFKQTEIVDNYLNEALKMNPDAIAFASLAMKNRDDNTEIMSRFPEKFTVVQGFHDALIPADKMKEFCTINEIGYIELPRAGHMSQVESVLDLDEVFGFLITENKI